MTSTAEPVLAAPPPPGNPDAGETTTIQVSKLQRVQISDIQADLIIERGRHVSTKETIGALIEYWKAGHPHDHD